MANTAVIHARVNDTQYEVWNRRATADGSSIAVMIAVLADLFEDDDNWLTFNTTFPNYKDRCLALKAERRSRRKR
jgi:hypothetical protein